MSFPNIPNITPLISVSVEQTIPLLLSSIALEELALAHIMNAEAEKLQFVLGTLGDTGVAFSPAEVSLGDLLDVNASVQRTLRDVIKKEMLLEFKFENVLDLIETLPVPPSCLDFVTLSNGATVEFTGLTNGGLTWNYEIVLPAPLLGSIRFTPFFPCALTNFVSCTSNPPGLCIQSAFDLCNIGLQQGILFVVNANQTTFTFSFTLNQQFPIGTINAHLDFDGNLECFTICGPMC